MEEHRIEESNSSVVFQTVENLVRKLEHKQGSRLGNVLQIDGVYARRSGRFYILPPHINRNTYILVHHDTIIDRKGGGRVDNLLGVWEISPEHNMITARGAMSIRSNDAMQDPKEIIDSALSSCTKKNVSVQPFWDLMTGIAMMDQDRATALAITGLPGFNSSDADEIRA